MTSPTVPDPEDVREAYDYLARLSDPDFARAFAGCVTAREADYDDVLYGSPHPVTKAVADAAFRSPDLIERSLAAVNFHIARTNNLLNQKSPSYDPRKAKQRQRFLELMGYERNILGGHRRALATLRGSLPDNSPNPRRRAMEWLWQQNLKGDVPKGAGRRMQARIEAELAAERDRARAERRAERRK